MEAIKLCWNDLFGREMYNQLLGSDLCGEIEFEYRMLNFRMPVFRKVKLLIFALRQYLDWDLIQVSILEGRCNSKQRKAILSFFLLLG